MNLVKTYFQFQNVVWFLTLSRIFEKKTLIHKREWAKVSALWTDFKIEIIVHSQYNWPHTSRCQFFPATDPSFKIGEIRKEVDSGRMIYRNFNWMVSNFVFFLRLWKVERLLLLQCPTILTRIKSVKQIRVTVFFDLKMKSREIGDRFLFPEKQNSSLLPHQLFNATFDYILNRFKTCFDTIMIKNWDTQNC